MSKNSTVYDCTIIELDKHHRDEGNITAVSYTHLTLPTNSRV